MKSFILLSCCMLCLCSASGQPPKITDNAVKGPGPFQQNYVGAGWVHGNNVSEFYNNTLSYSDVRGAYLTFSFDGGGIEWYTEKRNKHGIAAVSIDGEKEVLVDLYSSTEQHVMVYGSPLLKSGAHTIKIRATGTKNVASTGRFLIHDYFKVYDPVTTFRQDSTTTFTGLNAGLAPNVAGNPDRLRGVENSGFGYNTLRGILLGSGNTGIGANAFAGSYKSSENTALGHNALRNGGILRNGNTAVGAYALDVGEPGFGNTAVGYGAGPIQSAFQVGATALGTGAKTTASDQVRIGSSSVTSIGGQVSWSTLSDGRFKREVREDVSGLKFIEGLRPVSYTVDKSAINKFLGVTEVPAQYAGSEGIAKRAPTRHTGFIAQEVEALINKSGYVFNGVDAPQNDQDTYTIRYAEFVVPLVKAIQELSAKNKEQQKQIEELVAMYGKKTGAVSDPFTSEMSLQQNHPNPFSLNTDIKMVVPESTLSATIIVYDLEGRELKKLPVKGRGTTSVTILGNDLSAGMYIYTLIADGNIVDTKRMILTK